MSVCVEQTNVKINQYSHSFPASDEESLPQSSTESIGLLKKVFQQLGIWRNRSRQRNSLANLDERLLKDIGYTPSQARVEYSKPFWK